MFLVHLAFKSYIKTEIQQNVHLLFSFRLNIIYLDNF